MAVNSGQPCSTWWAAHLLPPFPLALGVLPSPTVLQKDNSLGGRGVPRAGSGWRQRQAWDQGSCLCLTTGPALCSRGCLTLIPSLCEFCSDGTPSPWTSLTSGVVLLLSPGPAWSPCSRGALIPGLLGPVSGLLQRADPGRGCRPTFHPQCCCERGVSFASYWARLGEAAGRLMVLGSFRPSTCWVPRSAPGCPPLSFAAHYLSGLGEKWLGDQAPCLVLPGLGAVLTKFPLAGAGQRTWRSSHQGAA